MNELFSVQFAILISRPHTHLCACIVIMAIEMTQNICFHQNWKFWVSVIASQVKAKMNLFLINLTKLIESHKVQFNNQFMPLGEPYKILVCSVDHFLVAVLKSSPETSSIGIIWYCLVRNADFFTSPQKYWIKKTLRVEHTQVGEQLF